MANTSQILNDTVTDILHTAHEKRTQHMTHTTWQTAHGTGTQGHTGTGDWAQRTAQGTLSARHTPHISTISRWPVASAALKAY